jgi:hypothetical protein
MHESKAVKTMRPRIFAFVALLGTIATVLGTCAAPQALAAPAEVKLKVNQNCVEPNWPCWTAETSGANPRPASRIAITDGGKVEFVEHDASTAASVNWTGGGATPACTGVPATATLEWEGSCKFEQPGIYRFESATMFADSYENYKKYEIVVEGTPKAKTTPTSAEHQTEATLTGSIEPEGNPTEYHFEYGSGSVSEHSSNPTSLGASDFTSHSVSLPLSDLLPDTEYHFELIVSYGANMTVSGGPQTFTTPPATQPTVSTLAASPLKETEATLNGKVDPEGGAEAEYFFEWGAGSGGSYEHTTNAVSLPSDGAEHQASATVTGLMPGSEYHFRLVAKNKLGSTQGTDLTFMSASTPPTKEPTKEPTKAPPAKEPTPTPTTAGGDTTATPSSSPPAGQPAAQPFGPLFGSVKLAPTHHSSSVHGTIDISQTAAGGKLEVTLLATAASLAKAGHSSKVRVGRLLRSSLQAGPVSFAVPLAAKARSALRAHKRLALTVQIVITPDHGAAVTVRRSIVLRLAG